MPLNIILSASHAPKTLMICPLYVVPSEHHLVPISCLHLSTPVLSGPLQEASPSLISSPPSFQRSSKPAPSHTPPRPLDAQTLQGL